jgi:hypothetical protein
VFGQRFRQDENAFLICAFGSLDPFKREMRRVRKEFGLADKEIEFKDFGMGPIQRALPAYLETLNGYVPGLLFTLVVDKRLKSLFGSSHKSTLETLAQMLEARGVGRRRPHVAEKVMRVVHTAAFLTALLGHEGQQIFWMSDHDAVCPNPAMHDQMLSLYHNILTLYTAKTFGRIGGGHPFDDRSTDFLDLLSAADIAVGAVGQYFTGRSAVGEENVGVKPGAEKVLGWLGVDALALKKTCVMIAAGDGAISRGRSNLRPVKSRNQRFFCRLSRAINGSGIQSASWRGSLGSRCPLSVEPGGLIAASRMAPSAHMRRSALPGPQWEQ